MTSSFRKYLSIAALSFAGGSIYTLPYLKYIFYDTQLEVMGINNTQSGLLVSMYAIGCILSYIPGGLITDKILPARPLPPLFSVRPAWARCMRLRSPIRFPLPSGSFLR